MPCRKSHWPAGLRDGRGGRRPDGLLGRDSCVAAGVVLAIASLHLWIDPSNPPGFHRDEASIAYNASTISTSLRDEHGGLLPLYIESFGDYKSPVFVYALAGLFRLTGPSSEVARGLGRGRRLLWQSCCSASRDTGERGTSAWRPRWLRLEGCRPWLFELGRVAVEVTLEPLVMVVLLLVLEDASRRNRWGVVHGVAAGAVLASLGVHIRRSTTARPLLAASLVVFARRGAAAMARRGLGDVRHRADPLDRLCVPSSGRAQRTVQSHDIRQGRHVELGGGADVCRQLRDRHQPVVVRHRGRSEAAHPHCGDGNAAGRGCSPRCGRCGALGASRHGKTGGPRSSFSRQSSLRSRRR